MKTIWIASDHAGFELKQKIVINLKQFKIIDLGCESAQSVDYPDFANLVAERVKGQSHEVGFGILICGSGQGMAMRSNKYPWVRAALVWNQEVAQLSREHNDANILCLGARFTDEANARAYIKIFDETKFAEGRHSQRVAKVSKPL